MSYALSMPRSLLLASLFASSLLLLASCDEGFDPSGSYRGIATVASQLSFPSEEAGTRRTVSSSTGVSGEVVVRMSGEQQFELRLTNGCSVGVSRSSPHNGMVLLDPPQRCQIREGDYEGPFELSGDATFDDAGNLRLSLTGAIPQPSEDRGSWGYEFNGQRQ
jgi:hypothetical protein